MGAAPVLPAWIPPLSSWLTSSHPSRFGSHRLLGRPPGHPLPFTQPAGVVLTVGVVLLCFLLCIFIVHSSDSLGCGAPALPHGMAPARASTSLFCAQGALAEQWTSAWTPLAGWESCENALQGQLSSALDQSDFC